MYIDGKYNFIDAIYIVAKKEKLPSIKIRGSFFITYFTLLFNTLSKSGNGLTDKSIPMLLDNL